MLPTLTITPNLLLEHVRQHRLHAVERALDVEVEGFLHQRVVDLEELGAADRGARRVEQELHGAERIERALDHVVDLRALGDVDLQRQRLAALGVDLRGGFLDAGLVEVGADHVGALAGEDVRGGAADAAAGAGDDDGLPGEIVRRLRHGLSPVALQAMRAPAAPDRRNAGRASGYFACGAGLAPGPTALVAELPAAGGVFDWPRPEPACSPRSPGRWWSGCWAFGCGFCAGALAGCAWPPALLAAPPPAGAVCDVRALPPSAAAPAGRRHAVKRQGDDHRRADERRDRPAGTARRAALPASDRAAPPRPAARSAGDGMRRHRA